MTWQSFQRAWILKLKKITSNHCISPTPPIQQVCAPTPRLFWGGQMTKCVNPYPVPTWSSDSHQVYLKLKECLNRMLQLSESMIKYFSLKIWGASFRSWLSGLHISLQSRAHNSNTEQIIQPGIYFFSNQAYHWSCLILLIHTLVWVRHCPSSGTWPSLLGAPLVWLQERK